MGEKVAGVFMYVTGIVFLGGGAAVHSIYSTLIGVALFVGSCVFLKN